jgi:hypothetical protein
MKKLVTIAPEIIQQKIYYIRGEKVMFDKDLAELYGVETKVLNQSVKRNARRFPSDFMFQLSNKEADIFPRYQSGTLGTGIDERSRSQFVTLKRGQNIKYLPNVFTEQGVAMLSSVLNSERAIQVNIQIMRTFTQIRKMLVSHKDLREKLDKMEKKYDKQFRVVFETLRLLLKDDAKPAKRIGFGK